jgi:hypothetical protein
LSAASEEFGRGNAVVRVDGESNADGKHRRISLLAQTPADALGDVLRAFPIGVQQKNGELVTAVTRGRFSAAAVLLHHTGQATLAEQI